LKLKAVSAEHCQIGYSPDSGWTLSEMSKVKLSSNGSYVYMKSLTQQKERKTSNLIPIADKMTISFVNYELRISLTEISQDMQKKLDLAANEYFNTGPLKILGYYFDPYAAEEKKSIVKKKD